MQQSRMISDKDWQRSKRYAITVPGKHFVQEDSGPRIGAAVAHWLKSIS